MRKGQLKILEIAKGIVGFPKIYIEYLENSERTLKDLNNLFVFLKYKFREYKKSNSFTLSEEDFEVYDIAKDIISKDWVFSYCIVKIGNKNAKEIFMKLDNLCFGIRDEYFRVLKNTVKIMDGNIISVDDAIKYAQFFVGDEKEYNKVLEEFLLLGVKWENLFSDKEEIIRNFPVKEKENYAQWTYEELLHKNSDEPFPINWDQSDAFKSAKLAIEKEISFSQFLVMQQQREEIKFLLLNSMNFGKENKSFVFDPNNSLKMLKKMVEEYHLKEKITLNVSGACAVNYFFSTNALNLNFKKVKSVTAFIKNNNEKEDYEFCYQNECQDEKYVLFFDNLGFYKKAKCSNKLIMMSLKMVKQGINKYGAPFQEFIDIIIDAHISRGDYIYKDIRIVLNRSSVYIPLNLHELNGKHTMQEVCNEKYKRDVPIKWNKGDLSINYLTYKAYFLVKEEDRGILLNFCENIRSEEEVSKFYDFMNRHGATNISSIYKHDYSIFFLTYLLFKQVDPHSFWMEEDGTLISEHDAFIIFRDYVSMSKQFKKKVKLSFKSAKKVKDAHADIIVDYMTKKRNIPIIKIPKKSVFNNLRKLLPEDEFEWIKTRKRLIAEGYYMRHCVDSYGHYINGDRCAIYSLVYKPTQKRYTIEFLQRNNSYYINQIQGKCNRGAPLEVRRHVESFIIDNQELLEVGE